MTLGALFGGISPQKLPVTTGLLPYRCSGVPEYACCVNKLRKKRWFADVNTASYCDVTNSV